MRVYYALRVMFAALLAAAAWISIRSALADVEFRRGTSESVAKAIELAPANTEYLQFRALQLDYDGSDSAPLLERAAALNPMSSSPRIRLGLRAETRGDFALAEKWLLEAASIDRQFEPRWTLANFYFRRENAEPFWKWIRAALEISYGDRRPAFDLCWRMSNGADEILRRAIPANREVLSAYLSYLLETQRTTALMPVALKLAANSEDRDLILTACDTLITAHSAAAWQLWRAMGFGEVSFGLPRVGRGFDWQRISSPGVVHLEIDQPRPMHRISFNGSQPESCDLLKRVLKLEPGHRYDLQWQAQPEFSGVEWRIANQRVPLKDGHLEFIAPADLVTLTLAYQRPQGEIRREGSLEIWNVELK
jgi:hypothetical protein